MWVLELVYQGNRQGNWACTSLRCGCEVGVRVGSVGVGLVLVSFGVGFRVGSGIVWGELLVDVFAKDLILRIIGALWLPTS